MGEKRTVPAFYPDFANADRWKSWDGTREAETWADLQKIRNSVIVATAARITRVVEGVDVGGLMVALWSLSDDEIAGVLQANMDQISRQDEEE